MEGAAVQATTSAVGCGGGGSTLSGGPTVIALTTAISSPANARHARYICSAEQSLTEQACQSTLTSPLESQLPTPETWSTSAAPSFSETEGHPHSYERSSVSPSVTNRATRPESYSDGEHDSSMRPGGIHDHHDHHGLRHRYKEGAGECVGDNGSGVSPPDLSDPSSLTAQDSSHLCHHSQLPGGQGTEAHPDMGTDVGTQAGIATPAPEGVIAMTVTARTIALAAVPGVPEAAMCMVSALADCVSGSVSNSCSDSCGSNGVALSANTSCLQEVETPSARGPAGAAAAGSAAAAGGGRSNDGGVAGQYHIKPRDLGPVLERLVVGGVCADKHIARPMMSRLSDSSEGATPQMSLPLSEGGQSTTPASVDTAAAAASDTAVSSEEESSLGALSGEPSLAALAESKEVESGAAPIPRGALYGSALREEANLNVAPDSGHNEDSGCSSVGSLMPSSSVSSEPLSPPELTQGNADCTVGTAVSAMPMGLLLALGDEIVVDAQNCQDRRQDCQKGAVVNLHVQQGSGDINQAEAKPEGASVVGSNAHSDGVRNSSANGPDGGVKESVTTNGHEDGDEADKDGAEQEEADVDDEVDSDEVVVRLPSLLVLDADLLFRLPERLRRKAAGEEGGLGDGRVRLSKR